MKRLYCGDCGNYLMGSDGECHDCGCGWKQPVECECVVATDDAAFEAIREENEQLKAEVEHWKANHADVVKRLRIATERPDLPVDRIDAINELYRLQELQKLNYESARQHFEKWVVDQGVAMDYRGDGIYGNPTVRRWYEGFIAAVELYWKKGN